MLLLGQSRGPGVMAIRAELGPSALATLAILGFLIVEIKIMAFFIALAYTG